jgi:transposase InsO family protein
VLLAREGVELTRGTIHRVLLRRDLVRESDRRRQALKRFEREEPNQLWQMDYKSPKGWNAAVGPLSVLDDHSRYLLVLPAVWSNHGAHVREQLEGVFLSCGVPYAMLMDQGVPWWSATAPTGATALTWWLMKQGIELHWSGYRHPQTQGKVERFHGSLERALQARAAPRQHSQAWLDEYRREYNEVRPHEALGMQTPASVWRKSERRYQPQPPPWEYPAGAKVRKLDCQGKLTVKGRNWPVSQALRGEWVQLEQIGERVLVYYCRTVIRELDLGNQRATAVARWFPASDTSAKV